MGTESSELETAPIHSSLCAIVAVVWTDAGPAAVVLPPETAKKAARRLENAKSTRKMVLVEVGAVVREIAFSGLPAKTQDAHQMNLFEALNV